MANITVLTSADWKSVGNTVFNLKMTKDIDCDSQIISYADSDIS